MTKRIGIVGGGASGVLAGIQCWEKLGKEAQILIFEPASRLGCGKAYSGNDTCDLLNVPAEKMSAYPDKPLDFLNWLIRHHPENRDSKHWPFVPRTYFGQYLEEQINAIPPANLTHIRSKVTSISNGTRVYKVHVEREKSHEVDYLIIATGYGADQMPFLKFQVDCLKEHILRPASLEVLPLEQFSGNVLILGSGLAALDVWRRMRKNTGLTFSFLSRRGLFPETHPSALSTNPLPVELPQFAGMSPLQILQVLRCIRGAHSISWAVIADQLRPQAQKIWTCWTDREKTRFVSHVKPYWEVIRHRMPGSVAKDLLQDAALERVRIISGRIQEIREAEDEDSLLVEYLPARSLNKRILTANWIVLAAGTSINQALHKRGSITGVRTCSHGFGYINDSAPRLWVIGPSSKSVYWEITAVPDIRQQARFVAASIADDPDPKASLRVQRISTHPNSIGESYIAHLKASALFGVNMWRLGGYALVHALLPFLHLDTTSSNLRNLMPVLSRRRQRVSNFTRFP